MAAAVTFVSEPGGERRIEVAPGESVMKAAMGAGIPIFHDCGGLARCTTCRVRIVAGEVAPRGEEEAEIARMLSFGDDIRLACQIRPDGDLRVERMMRQEFRRDRGVEPDPGARSEERQLAVLFCDVNGFTEFAARKMPYDVVHVVNRLFLRIGDAVLGNDGFIDKYLGDGLLALWGLEGGEPRELVLNAVRAALLMQHTVRELGAHLSSHFAGDLSLRVGIHFGPAIIGRIGHPARQQLTVIGDTVNVASRVETQNKELRTNLLVTEECMDQVRDLVIVGDDFKTVLRGHERPRRLYEITGLVQPDPVFLVQRQIYRVMVDGHRFVDRFYRRLFERAPELRALFEATSMPRQHEMFLNQLAWTVRELRNLPSLLENLAELGERHRAYGVRPEHFPPAAAALLDALAETLGAEFDVESRAAWTQSIQSLAAAMQAEPRDGNKT